jgi:hypothetical protein
MMNAMSRLISAILALAVAGCVDQRPDNSNAAGQEQSSAEQEQTVPEGPLNAIVPGPSPDAGENPAAAGKEPAMLSGIFSPNSVTLPMALNRGVFRRNGDCLEVVVGGQAFTPILFAVPRNTGSGFAASSKVYEYGRRYILEGGPMLASDEGVEVSEQVRKSCVREYYAVGGIRPTK